MNGHDLYLRYDGGPVQRFRVWDAARFYAARVHDEEEISNKGGVPRVISHATRDEYMTEQCK